MRLLAGMGAGFDIVSGGELERVRKAQKKALKKIVFSGVGKTAGELELALRSGILLFNVESEGELELLAASAAKAAQDRQHCATRESRCARGNASLHLYWLA